MHNKRNVSACSPLFTSQPLQIANTMPITLYFNMRACLLSEPAPVQDMGIFHHFSILHNHYDLNLCLQCLELRAISSLHSPVIGLHALCCSDYLDQARNGSLGDISNPSNEPFGLMEALLAHDRAAALASEGPYSTQSNT